jgi:hypothetical protein
MTTVAEVSGIEVEAACAAAEPGRYIWLVAAVEGCNCDGKRDYAERELARLRRKMRDALEAAAVVRSEIGSP